MHRTPSSHRDKMNAMGWGWMGDVTLTRRLLRSAMDAYTASNAKRGCPASSASGFPQRFRISKRSEKDVHVLDVARPCVVRAVCMLSCCPRLHLCLVMLHIKPSPPSIPIRLVIHRLLAVAALVAQCPLAAHVYLGLRLGLLSPFP